MDFDPDRTRDGEFVDVDFSGSRFRNVNLENAKIMEAYLVNARLSGLITGLIINDVEVAPLIEAELNRRDPERARLNPDNAAEVREAWAIIESRWSATLARTCDLPEDLFHRRVDGEWSFLETVRHLISVTDGWIRGPVLGVPDPQHPMGVAASFVTDAAAMGLDTTLDPPSVEVLAVREERLNVVREFIGSVTDDELNRSCGEQTVLSCVHILLDEEWHHLGYANRDLTLVIDS